MITRVLFVDSDTNAVARIKESLERTGNYEAAAFSTGQAALEYAAQRPPSAAVIALNLRDITPPTLVVNLRKLHPALPLILRVPGTADEEQIRAMHPHGVLRGPYATRTLVAALKEAMQGLPADEPALDEEHDTRPLVDAGEPMQFPDLGDDMTAFGEVLQSIDPAQQSAKDDTFNALVDSLRAPEDKPSLPERQRRSLASLLLEVSARSKKGEAPRSREESEAVFARLAAEEPPMPTLDDSGTVADLIAAADPDFAETPTPQPKVITDEMIDLDFSAMRWPEGDSGQDEEAENTAAVVLKALEVPPLPTDVQFSAVDSDLLAALAAASEPPRVIPPGEPGAGLMSMPEHLQAQFEGKAPAPNLNARPPRDKKKDKPGSKTPMPDTSPGQKPAPRPDVDVAEIAVQLTQLSLESSAQAILLLREGRIAASAGALAREDVAALAAMIDGPAILASGAQEIKFVALPNTGANFLIVSTPTLDGMVLSMIFTGSVQLRHIRRQARQMVEALTAPPPPPPGTLPEASPPLTGTLPDATGVMEAPAAESAEARASVTGPLERESQDAAAPPTAAEGDTGEIVEAREAAESAPALDPAAMARYACAWILRNPASELDAELTGALPGWLEEIITGQHWLVDQVDAQPDYVAAVLSVPPNETPSQVVQRLMNETAVRIVAARADLAPDAASLWADAYYVVAPGRPLTGQEISRFISYQREA